MATYAVMNGNSVSTIIVADNKEETELALGVTLIEYTPENPAGIGSFYDAENGRFLAPTPVRSPDFIEPIGNGEPGSIGPTIEKETNGNA